MSDIFINGKHFPFTTAAYMNVELARSCSCRGASPCPAECNGDCSASCPAECNGSCGPGSIQLYPGNLTCQNANPCPLACGGDCSSASTQTYPAEWMDNCVETTLYTACSDPDGCNLTYCPPDPLDPLTCDRTSTVTWASPPVTVGCAKLYDIIPNHPGFTNWCDSGCPVDNLTAEERFDLDRDGTSGTPDPDVPAGVERERFAWQWFLVAGWDAGHRVRPQRMTSGSGFGGRGGFSTYRPAQTVSLMGEGIIQESSACKENCKGPRHTNIDVDGDLKRESMMVDTKVVDNMTGVIKSFVVLDRQRGDMDMTRGDSDLGPDPGLQKDIRMYSFVRGGTYLLLEEGRLYDGYIPGQFIRTAQKKDQVDLIERTIQLSNDTGRFCDGSTPVDTSTGIWTDEMPNPVEACQNCSSGANIQKTCMDRVSKKIIVRSRIEDKRGRKWVTNTSGDDYVDFVVPSVP